MRLSRRLSWRRASEESAIRQIQKEQQIREGSPTAPLRLMEEGGRRRRWIGIGGDRGRVTVGRESLGAAGSSVVAFWLEREFFEL